MYKYEVYRIEDDRAILDSVCEFDEYNEDAMKIVHIFDKNPEFYVLACNENSIWELRKPKRPGLAKLTDRLVLEVFELRAKEQLSAALIARRLYENHGIFVSGESIDKVLKRKTYSDVIVPQELLDQIAIKKVSRKKRSSITEEHGIEILELSKSGLSGRQISQMDKYDYADATINKFIRKKLGFKTDRDRNLNK